MLDGNQFTVFDNNNRDQQTEIRTYCLDMKNKKAELVRSYGFNNKFSQACGSVQTLAGSLCVIGWGWATTDNECMSVINTDTGEKLMGVTLGDPKNITIRTVTTLKASSGSSMGSATASIKNTETIISSRHSLRKDTRM